MGESESCSDGQGYAQFSLVQLLSHVQLRDPMDCSLPGSSVHGILQARILAGVGCHFLSKLTSLAITKGQRIYLQCGKPGFDLWVGKIPWSRKWQPTLVFLPGESPWIEKPGGLQSMGLRRVRYN